VNISPVLRLRGKIHSSSMRTVAPVEAADAERDPETGRIVRDAVEAREGYDVVDFVVHTDDGGYALVVFRGEHFEEALGGVLPDQGAGVDWPVRNFITWSGRAGRRFPTVGYAVAGEVVIAESKRGGGRRADSSAAA
jgi:hypothetical protein